MEIVGKLKKHLEDIIDSMGATDAEVVVERSADTANGDYSTNVAFALSKSLKKSPLEIAEEIVTYIKDKKIVISGIEKIEAVKPGFVNFFLSSEYLIGLLGTGNKMSSSILQGKKIMVEYAHPNTHKEMHIGHMRTLITGEAISRLFEAVGTKVFRANYQGDIGPHVAKALWGIREIMEREQLSLDDVRGLNNVEKAHFLGKGYVSGSTVYEENKEAIDGINSELYAGIKETEGSEGTEGEIWKLYQETRQWSLDYYQDFYARFYTKFDQLFFESQMVEDGKRIVKEDIGKVFKEENGAVTFPGEQYGLHTRVFITQAGNPTYEGKEMANAFAEYDAFPFDQKTHIVGSEQAGYFQVVFKALELIDPEKFKGKQHHVSMGMVTLTDRKMSSRTGDILRVDWLLDQVQARVEKLLTDERVPEDERGIIIEQIVVGAVKYSVLKVGTGQNVAFNIETSVSLEGDSGPYLQYTYARTQSVLRKAEVTYSKQEKNFKFQISNFKVTDEDSQLLRLLAHFDEVVVSAAEKYSPNVLCGYLYELAKAFNLFYQKSQILKEKEDLKNFRLALTGVVGERIKHGLYLLGIEAPERM